MFKSKFLFLTFALTLTISCSNEEKPDLSKSSEEVSDKKPIQQSFDEYYAAALTGDLAKLKNSDRIVIEGINTANEEGQTFLMLASFNGHTEVCKYLINNGAHIEARDNSGRTALMYSSTGPFPTTVELLLKSGANVNSVDHGEKFTSLMNAAAEGQMEVVKILLKYGANKNLTDIDGDTAESFALQNNHLAVANFLKNYTE